MKNIQKLVLVFFLFMSIPITKLNAQDASTKEELLAAISEGGEINVTADIVVDGQINITKDVTINLGSYKISSTSITGYNNLIRVNGENVNVVLNGAGTIESNHRGILVVNGAYLELNGPKIKAGHQGVTIGGTTATTSAEFVMKSGSVESVETGVAVFADSHFTMDGGTIKTVDNCAVSGNGSIGYSNEGIIITINKGTLDGNITSNGYASCGIYMPGRGILNVNGGTIKSSKGAGIVMRAGVLNMTNGLINANSSDANFKGKVGDSTITITTSGIVVEEKSNYPYFQTDGITINISGGVINGKKSAIEYIDKGNSTLPHATWNITGGTYSSNVQDFLSAGFINVIQNNKYIIKEQEVTTIEDDELTNLNGNASDDLTTASTGVVGSNDTTSGNAYNITGVITDENTLTTRVDETPVLESSLTNDEKDNVDEGKTIISDQTGKTKAEVNIISVYEVEIVLIDETNGDVGTVTETAEDVLVTLPLPPLPEVEPGHVRIFKIIRIHNGVAEVIPYESVNDDEISFRNGKFSKFIITYVDKKYHSYDDEDEEEVLTVEKEYGKITLDWAEEDGYKGYKIYRKIGKKGKWKLIKTIKKSSTTTYTDTKVVAGKKYYYRVRPYKNVKKKIKYGKYTNTESSYALRPEKSSLYAYDKSKTKVSLSIEEVDDATGYAIYRKVGNKGKWKLVKRTTSTDYTNTKLKKNTTYYYKVKSYVKVGKKRVYSRASKIIKVKTSK